MRNLKTNNERDVSLGTWGPSRKRRTFVVFRGFRGLNGVATDLKLLLKLRQHLKVEYFHSSKSVPYLNAIMLL